MFFMFNYSIFNLYEGIFKTRKINRKIGDQNQHLISKVKNKKNKTIELNTLNENIASQYDIAKICIREVDTPTLIKGMSSIIALMIEPEIKALDDIRETIISYFKELSEYAIRIDSAKMLIMALYSVSIDGCKTKNIQITKEANYCLYRVGMSSLEYEQRKDAETVCKALISFNIKYLLNNLELVLEATSFCNTIGSSVRPDEPELKYEFFSESLRGRSSQRTILDLVAEYLQHIVCLSLEKGDVIIAKKAIEELKDMGRDGLHNKKPKVALIAVEKLYEVIELYSIVKVHIKEEDFEDICNAVKDAISWITIQEGVNEEVKEKASIVYSKIASHFKQINKPEKVEEMNKKINLLGLSQQRL